ncbi:thioredoxin domain-containing protein 17-like [Styela clava]
MANQIAVEGYEAFMSKISELEEQKKEIYCLFSGSVDPQSGKNWCPDCVKADPVIEKCLPNMPEGAVFVHCHVGQRDYWKNKTNDFRVHPKLKLSGVPTLLKWGEPKKLVEDQLFNPDMINMMFED